MATIAGWWKIDKTKGDGVIYADIAPLTAPQNEVVHKVKFTTYYGKEYNAMGVVMRPDPDWPLFYYMVLAYGYLAGLYILSFESYDSYWNIAESRSVGALRPVGIDMPIKDQLDERNLFLNFGSAQDVMQNFYDWFTTFATPVNESDVPQPEITVDESWNKTLSGEWWFPPKYNSFNRFYNNLTDDGAIEQPIYFSSSGIPFNKIVISNAAGTSYGHDMAYYASYVRSLSGDRVVDNGVPICLGDGGWVQKDAKFHIIKFDAPQKVSDIFYDWFTHNFEPYTFEGSKAVIVEYAGAVDESGRNISISPGSTATFACAGKTMRSNVLVDNKGYTRINIDGEWYFAEPENMQWGYWVESKYNTGGFWIDPNTRNVLTSDGKAVCSTRTDQDMRAYDTLSEGNSYVTAFRFTVDGQQYITPDQSMSWGDWIKTRYNRLPFKVEGARVYTYDGKNVRSGSTGEHIAAVWPISYASYYTTN